MGASVTGGGRSGARGGGRKNRYRPMAEINVTPFVDVMLVLLVVFMVAAPLLVPGIQVQQPKAQAKPLPQDSKPLSITINHEGAIFIVETEITLDELVPRLTAIAGNNKDTRIYLIADRRLDYGNVVAVLGAITTGGFNKVSLTVDNN
jgi:biopolymer transport protein TolR